MGRLHEERGGEGGNPGKLLKVQQWSLTTGTVQTSLKAHAERNPGEFVDGWTDRPVVSPLLEPVWYSWLDFCRHGDGRQLGDIVRWVDVRHRHESSDSRGLLVEVFCEMSRQREELLSSAAEAEAGPSD